MIDRQQEPELHAQFELQKRVDAQAAPSFADVMARAQAEATRDAVTVVPIHSRVVLRRFGWATGLAAAAAIAALIVVPRVRSNDAQFEQAVEAFSTNPALGGWRSPTDGLLNLPGSQLISTVPSVGTRQQ
jgi:predicted amidophosphoribosyltransferase